MAKQPAGKRCLLFGASGKTGQLLARALDNAGYDLICLSRSPEKLSDLPGQHKVADLSEPESLQGLVQKGDLVVNAAHARYTRALLAICPVTISQLVVLGSTRYLTRFPDRPAEEVRDAMAALEAWNGPWTLLHPTMIYGAAGENNIRRMAALIRRFRLIPLPKGGASLIQPIHVEDVVAAVLASLENPACLRQSLHIAGPEPVSYRTFIKMIAAAIGSRCLVLPLPEGLLHLLAAVTRLLPGLPNITSAEVKRLTEDKNVDTAPMVEKLGLKPRPLRQGLTEMFGGKG